MLVRLFLEKLSRNRVVRRRLPAEHGGHCLYVSPDAAMKFWRRDLGTTDPFLLRMAAELARPGMGVWDIGANVGLFAFAAAYAVGPSGRVLAVEADAWLAELIERSSRKTPASYARIEVLSAAVSDVPGVTEFCIAERGRAGNHLRKVAGSTQTGGIREVRQIASVTLDGLLDRLPEPQIVKIDVEGAEALCLRGAIKLLREVRPIVLCEIAEENAAEVGTLLRSHGYTLFDAAILPDQRQVLERPAWNTLALPEARA